MYNILYIKNRIQAEDFNEHFNYLRKEVKMIVKINKEELLLIIVIVPELKSLF